MAKKVNRSAASKAKKAAYDKKFNATATQKKKRADRNRKRKEQLAKGNPKASKGSGYDYDHATGRMVKASVNRGRRGEGNRVSGKRGKGKKS